MATPSWLKEQLKPKSQEVKSMRAQLGELACVNTVCESALCPNRGECFSKGTMTFMILGNICTRNCSFCAVTSNTFQTPLPKPDNDELQLIVNLSEKLKIKYLVVTSVTRDDLPDGGASHFAKLINTLRSKPETEKIKIEVLTPDFKGNTDALKIVFDAKPDIFNHNLETIPRLYPQIRPQANFKQSLKVLKQAKKAGLMTKSGVMVGIGETKDDIFEVLRQLKNHQVDIVTIGQYLSPSRNNFKVQRYVEPAEFAEYKDFGTKLGFQHIFSGPLVRSSYRAAEIFEKSI